MNQYAFRTCECGNRVHLLKRCQCGGDPWDVAGYVNNEIERLSKLLYDTNITVKGIEDKISDLQSKLVYNSQYTITPLPHYHQHVIPFEWEQ